jgi:hypothetical protein
VVREPPCAIAIPFVQGLTGGGDGTSARGCDPSYPDDCLRDGIGDYDCEGGSGNGPNYVSGPVAVSGADPFGLDANGDGVGCES